MTNSEVRAWYLEQVAQIAGEAEAWQSDGLPLKDRAYPAHLRRTEIRLQARRMMESEPERQFLRSRDLRM